MREQMTLWQRERRRRRSPAQSSKEDRAPSEVTGIVSQAHRGDQQHGGAQHGSGRHLGGRLRTKDGGGEKAVDQRPVRRIKLPRMHA